MLLMLPLLRLPLLLLLLVTPRTEEINPFLLAQAMTMLNTAENHELYLQVIGPLIGALIEEVSRRSIHIVSEEHGWDLKVKLRLGGGCGVFGDQSVRLKATGKESSGRVSPSPKSPMMMMMRAPF